MTKTLLRFVALAAICSLLSSADSVCADESIRLAYKFAPGGTSRFKVSHHTFGSRLMSGASEATPVDVRVSGVIALRCVRMLRDGAAEITVERESASLKLGGVASEYQAPSGVERIALSRRGRIVREAAQPKDESTPHVIMDLGSIESILRLAVLPEKPVSVGDTWTAAITPPISSRTKLCLGFRLQEIKVSAGEQLAVIGVTMSTSPDGDVEAPEPKVSLEGTADVLFSVDRGMLVSAKGLVRTSLTTYRTARAGDSGGLVAEARYIPSAFRLESEFSMQRLDETKGAGRSGKP